MTGENSRMDDEENQDRGPRKDEVLLGRTLHFGIYKPR